MIARHQKILDALEAEVKAAKVKVTIRASAFQGECSFELTYGYIDSLTLYYMRGKRPLHIKCKIFNNNQTTRFMVDLAARLWREGI
jgi:hypothetical protein